MANSDTANVIIRPPIAWAIAVLAGIALDRNQNTKLCRQVLAVMFVCEGRNRCVYCNEFID